MSVDDWDKADPPDRNLRAVLNILDAITAGLAHTHPYSRLLGKAATTIISYLVSHHRDHGPGSSIMTTYTDHVRMMMDTTGDQV